MSHDITKLKNVASQVRRDIVRMVHAVNSGHPGGSLGCTEYFVALYFDVMKRKEGFDIDMQFKLRDVCDELDSKGVKFLLSNSDTKIINELYLSYNIKKVFASRAINANAAGRGKITEVLVRNY